MKEELFLNSELISQLTPKRINMINMNDEIDRKKKVVLEKETALTKMFEMGKLLSLN